MDPWDFSIHLGIFAYQPKSKHDLVASMSKEDAHQCAGDEGCQAILSAEGDRIWLNQAVHDARMQIRIPEINQLDQTPLDPATWEDAVLAAAGTGAEPTRTIATHGAIYPSVHQLAAATNIIDRSYLDPEHAPHHRATSLCDDVGVGRTLTFLMVITLRHHFSSNRKIYEERGHPGCMAAWKKPWSVGKLVGAEKDGQEIEGGLLQDVSLLSVCFDDRRLMISEATAMPIRWVGDRIPGTQSTIPHRWHG